MQCFFRVSCFLLLLGSLSQSIDDNYGKEFIVPFTGTARQIRHASLEILAMEGKTVIQLEFGSQRKRIEIEHRFKRLPLMMLMSRVGPRQPHKGIHLSSSAPIALYKLWKHNRFICIPVLRLSSKYIIANYLPSLNCRAHFSVTAKEEATKVTIKFRIAASGKCAKYRSGTDITISLVRLGVYVMQCDTDMTGTHISSNKPVAVIAGSECPTGKGVQRVDMMLFPNHILGTSFVLTSNKKMASLCRVISTKARTKLVTSDGRTWTTSPWKTQDIQLTAGKPLCIIASRPVQILGVFQPKYRSDRRGGFGRGPGTGVIVNQVPSTGQFLKKYTIHADGMRWGGVRVKKQLKYVVTAVVQKDVAQLLVSSLRKVVNTNISVQHMPSCEFVIVSTPLTFNGLLSLESPVPFGLFIYEFGPRKDFGILPGVLLDNTNCPTHKGFLYFASVDLCVRLEKKMYSIRMARKVCRKSGGHLVDITPEKHKIIRKIYGKEQNSTIYTGGFRYPHYGNKTKVWLWTDCSPVRQRPWSKGRHPWKCLTLRGKEMVLTQTDCHITASSICEVDVRHGPFNGHLTKSRMKCSKPRHSHSRGHSHPRHSLDTFTVAITDHQTHTVSSTRPTSHPSNKTSQRDNVTESNDFYTNPNSTHPSGMGEKDTIKTFLHKNITITTGVSTPGHTEPHYEEYEMKDYDEQQKEASEDDTPTTGIPSPGHTEPQYVEYEMQDYDEPQKEASEDDKEYVTTKVTEVPQPTTNKITENIQNHTTSNINPERRRLNMTLVMEAYLKHTHNAKSILAERERILTLAKKVKLRCHCFCKSQRLQNTSEEAIQEHKERVKKELGVKKRDLRKTLMKKISANDKRASAAVIGCIGFLFLLLPFAAIILSDISTVMARRRNRARKNKKTDIYVNLSNESSSKNTC